jgi:hypothetical protein
MRMPRFAKYHTGPPPSKVAGYAGGAEAVDSDISGAPKLF